jgi:hypothetical protein
MQINPINAAPARPIMAQAVQNAAWQVFDAYSNGDNIHLEMPGNPQVETDGQLTIAYTIVGANQYSFWTSNIPRAGITPDQALAMFTAIIQKNGGFVSNSSMHRQGNQTILDIEGGVPAQLLTLKGRIIVTPGNVFYLETLSPNGANLHSEFVRRFKITN